MSGARKPPILSLPDESRATCAALPAVAVIAAGGFLSLALPVARFGPRGNAVAYVLVRYEQRSALWESLAPEACDALLPGRGYALSNGRLTWFRSSGSPGASWLSAESLWVNAHWLLKACEAVVDARMTHGLRLLAEACRQALLLCGDEVPA